MVLTYDSVRCEIIEGGAYIEADGSAGLGKRHRKRKNSTFEDGDMQDELVVTWATIISYNG